MKKTVLLLTALMFTWPTFAADFSDYAVTPAQVRRIPALGGKDYAQFRTRANDLLANYRRGKEKTLAGHVIFTTFGCGTECVVLLGINLLNGDVRLFDVPAFRYEFRNNSRLLIVNRGGERGMSSNYPEEQYVVSESMQLKQIR